MREIKKIRTNLSPSNLRKNKGFYLPSLLLVVLIVLVLGLYHSKKTTALQQPMVAVIGCSNSGLIDQAYTNVSTRDVTYDAAQGGYSLKYWATDTTHPNGWQDSSTGTITNPPFDTQYPMYGATAVWYPICIVNGTYTGTTQQRQKAAWSDFKSFYNLLRARTHAPLYVTDKIGDDPTICTEVDQEMMTFVVNRAVQLGLATKSSPDMPVASSLHPDGCHFDPIMSTNIGDAAVQFLDQ